MLSRFAVRRRVMLTLLPLSLAACSDGSRTGSTEGSAAASADSSEFATRDVAEPPPSRVTTRRTEVDIAGLVKTRSESSTSEPAAAPPPPGIVPPAPRPVQAGLLTAGDHDDLLNPELYAEYAGRFLQQAGADLPFVDTRTRVAIKLVDAGGRPVPFARVEIARKGAPLRLVSAADGTASFYPAFDHVPARTRIAIASEAGNVQRGLDLGGRGARRIAIALPGQARPVSALDLTLVVDTTGSMSDEMTYLQAELDAILARVRREAGNVDVRIGLIVYRDEGDDYVVRASPLTGDMGSVRASLARQEAGGGGDMPEAVDQAIAAAERMQWRPGAAKALLFVADAPPHDAGFAPTLASAERLRSRGVQIVPVGASGVEDKAEYLMRTMAALTQGRYLFLTDDSGVGDAHAEPDVACYVVTRLDQLIARVLAGIVEGRRIEPGRAEIVRTVGDYDRGRCLGTGITPGQGDGRA